MCPVSKALGHPEGLYWLGTAFMGAAGPPGLKLIHAVLTAGGAALPGPTKSPGRGGCTAPRTHLFALAQPPPLLCTGT